jgi:hypothetical protein
MIVFVTVDTYVHEMNIETYEVYKILSSVFGKYVLQTGMYLPTRFSQTFQMQVIGITLELKLLER